MWQSLSANSKLRQGLAVGLIAVAVLAGALIVKQAVKSPEPSISPEITLEPNRQMTEPLAEAMSDAEKQAIDDKFAKEGAEMTVLQDVNGSQSVGTAWRLFDGVKFFHKVEATNLAGLDKGYFYEGWLVGDGGFFSTGRMAVEGAKAYLYFTSEEDKSAYRGVVITWETEDGNSAPDKHILEGSF